MQSGARTFADGVQAADAALSVQIHLDATAEIMGGGGYRYVFLCNVYTDAEAFLVYVREVLLGFFGVFVGDVQRQDTHGPHRAVSFRCRWHAPRCHAGPARVAGRTSA